MLALSSSPSRQNDATCGDCALRRRAGGDAKSEAPNASSKSAARKAGNLREPCFQPEQPVPDGMCVRSLGSPCERPEPHSAEGSQPPLFCVPWGCTLCTAPARGTAQSLPPLLLAPSSEQPFHSKASLWWLLSLQCPPHVAAEGHTGCALLPSFFLREQPGPGQDPSLSAQ